MQNRGTSPGHSHNPSTKDPQAGSQDIGDEYVVSIDFAAGMDGYHGRDGNWTKICPAGMLPGRFAGTTAIVTLLQNANRLGKFQIYKVRQHEDFINPMVRIKDAVAFAAPYIDKINRQLQLEAEEFALKVKRGEVTFGSLEDIGKEYAIPKVGIPEHWRHLIPDVADMPGLDELTVPFGRNLTDEEAEVLLAHDKDPEEGSPKEDADRSPDWNSDHEADDLVPRSTVSKALAERLQLNKKTAESRVHAAIHSNRLPWKRIGKPYFIPRSAANAFIREEYQRAKNADPSVLLEVADDVDEDWLTIDDAP